MEPSQQLPWVQTIGRIAVHQPEREPRALNGSSRLLLAILVAAGRNGAPIEQIANCYWSDDRPVSWQIALRVSASHLSAQLPDGWKVLAQDGQFRLEPGDGFVDLWVVEKRHESLSHDVEDIAWLDEGPLFADISGVEMIEEAKQRLEPIVQGIRSYAQIYADAGKGPTFRDAALVEQVTNAQRLILLGPTTRRIELTQPAIADKSVDTHIVIGDRGLHLPLGPFAMTFPALRSEIQLERGVVEPGAAARAFRIVADSLAERARLRPQRLLISQAHELDTTSLKLTSLLVDQGRLSDFSMLLCADRNYRELRWLDFMRRSITAGCPRPRAGLKWGHGSATWSDIGERNVDIRVDGPAVA